MSQKIWQQLFSLYMPFVDRLYTLLAEKAIAVSPCSEQGTRFLDPPNATLARADDGTSMPELLGSVMLNREGAGPSHLRAPRWQGQGPLGSNVSHPKGNDG
eukprot:CAMPEP_0181249154 /NCGR_PEP_ID=MMETSP1096-20121128/45596_1 /TAXON_ID=156174 ORGANISM="Chrysochromulina ericina, Strain CCMP281" /NCGR_SAMPLE_ID=MMETSP1096 /ASSEMBLY_ACC=CAM_ASM_000453 /LENGTH=100 /DNA_ID=CAMNT_0023346459 /DNA_START=6 /DNA_END=309 /DNA_ORIENTATION=-